jgi:hypothetical protein
MVEKKYKLNGQKGENVKIKNLLEDRYITLLEPPLHDKDNYSHTFHALKVQSLFQCAEEKKCLRK